MEPRALALLTAFSKVALGQALSDSGSNMLDKRQTNHHEFKGEKIPDINWTSVDTVNFTWGLTGVDNYENSQFASNLWLTLGVWMFTLVAYRAYVSHTHYIRLIANIASTRPGQFFAQPLSSGLLFFEQHLAIAPLFRRRHNEPFTLVFFKLHMGTLPSRLNSLMLFGYILSNVLYCTLLLPWNGHIGPNGKIEAPTRAALISEFRGRTGVMAVANTIPLFICMMRNNYVGKAVGVGFNTWNLYHRWIGRIVFLESWAHLGAWTTNKVEQAGWSGVGEVIAKSPFLQMGLMAEIALLMIVITSLAPLRHSHYQVFLFCHQVLVVLFLAGLWMHCHIDQLPHELYVNLIICMWLFERLHRLLTIWTKNFSLSATRKKLTCNVATVSCVPAGEDAVHVSVAMRNGWEYKPGTHAYIYIPRLSWTQSHPFSIAWSSYSHPSEPLQIFHPDTKIPIPLAHRDLRTSKSMTNIHFIISRRAGFTNRLFDAATRSSRFPDPEKPQGQPAQFYAFVEGPYTNESYSFDSFTSLLFVAGGSGITHPLGHLRKLLTDSQHNLVVARRLKLAWVVRDMKNITWVSEWLDELWRLDGGRGILEVEIYVTRPSPGQQPPGEGESQVQWRFGRPSPDLLVNGMCGGKWGGAVSVNVCGPGALADGLRHACRERIGRERVEFSEESFTWS